MLIIFNLNKFILNILIYFNIIWNKIIIFIILKLIKKIQVYK